MTLPAKPAIRADRILRLMEKATRANMNTPSCTGFLMELPAEGEIMVAGDIHGNMANLRRLIKLANLQRNPHRHMVVHELVHEMHDDADASRSYHLVEMAARMKIAFPKQFHYLPGNHEFSEAVDLEIGKNGRLLNVAFMEGLREAYGEHASRIKNAYRRFWATSPLAIRTAGRIFICHSTPRLNRMTEMSLDYLRSVQPAQVFRRNGPAFFLLWGRDYRASAADAFAERVDADIFIVGHTPCDDGMSVPNHRHVILDTTTFDGCYVVLPLDRPLTQSEVISRVKHL